MSMFSVLAIPILWVLIWSRSPGFREWSDLTYFTYSLWDDVLVYVGFPVVVLVLAARWLGYGLMIWYERELHN